MRRRGRHAAPLPARAQARPRQGGQDDGGHHRVAQGEQSGRDTAVPPARGLGRGVPQVYRQQLQRPRQAQPGHLHREVGGHGHRGRHRPRHRLLVAAPHILHGVHDERHVPRGERGEGRDGGARGVHPRPHRPYPGEGPQAHEGVSPDQRRGRQQLPRDDGRADLRERAVVRLDHLEDGGAVHRQEHAGEDQDHLDARSRAQGVRAGRRGHHLGAGGLRRRVHAPDGVHARRRPHGQPEAHGRAREGERAPRRRR
mmetsp:Transcript_21621/g.73515  ORF Transcript_21621/g.73515 Transcript_21621/m.73515 type:complete len:255 (+) Transcript_21621:857-1621(+)